MKLLVTGGSGFIGSAVLRLALSSGNEVINVDKLTYAAAPGTLSDIEAHPDYYFAHHDICDRAAMDRIFAIHQPDAIIHLAAESHVDRSISDPGAFIRTNVLGTQTLLDAARQYFDTLVGAPRDEFRFLHVSTDEVFGSLGDDGYFSESTPYAPNSPYSASKAASDHLVRAWGATYGLPVLITNCSNNYGPFQFPEKLIPLTVLKVLSGQPIPVYGSGENIRDWLYVDDHASALMTVLKRAPVGESYTIGGNAELRNIDLVHRICATLDTRLNRAVPASSLIRMVTDRAGHDHRYAIDAGKLRSQLGWSPRITIGHGLDRTLNWYLDNADWWTPLQPHADRKIAS